MKITTQQIKQIISEEISKIFEDNRISKKDWEELYVNQLKEALVTLMEEHNFPGEVWSYGTKVGIDGLINLPSDKISYDIMLKWEPRHIWLASYLEFPDIPSEYRGGGKKDVYYNRLDSSTTTVEEITKELKKAIEEIKSEIHSYTSPYIEGAYTKAYEFMVENENLIKEKESRSLFEKIKNMVILSKDEFYDTLSENNKRNISQAFQLWQSLIQFDATDDEEEKKEQEKIQNEINLYNFLFDGDIIRFFMHKYSTKT